MTTKHAVKHPKHAAKKAVHHTKAEKADVAKELEGTVVTGQQAIAVALEEGKVQEWTAPFPSTGIVRCMLTEDTGVSEIHDNIGRITQHKKGAVVLISAEHAQSLHRSITTAPEVA